MVIDRGEARTGRSCNLAATLFMRVAGGTRVPVAGRDGVIRTGTRPTLAGADASRRQHQQ